MSKRKSEHTRDGAPAKRYCGYITGTDPISLTRISELEDFIAVSTKDGLVPYSKESFSLLLQHHSRASTPVTEAVTGERIEERELAQIRACLPYWWTAPGLEDPTDLPCFPTLAQLRAVELQIDHAFRMLTIFLPDGFCTAPAPMGLSVSAMAAICGEIRSVFPTQKYLDYQLPHGCSHRTWCRRTLLLLVRSLREPRRRQRHAAAYEVLAILCEHSRPTRALYGDAFTRDR